jgi:hypothetical protein
MDDFLSKLSQARFVVISNGRVALTKTVTRSELLAHGKLGAFADLFVAPDTSLVPGATIYGDAPEWTTVEPLESQRLGVGQHTISVYWTMTAQHCDGFSTNVANDCLPADESLVTSATFEVIAQ